MSRLRHALIDYLLVRRALGFTLKRAEKLLDQFLTYVEQCGETHLRLPTMLAWATQPGSGDALRTSPDTGAFERRAGLRPH